jgi:hypothetical protein
MRNSILPEFARGLAPGPFTVPPGPLMIDWQHPLSRELMMAFVPGVMSGVNLANRIVSFNTNAAGDLMTPDGPAFSVGGTPQVDPVSVWVTGEVTAYACGYITATPTANTQIITVGYLPSGAPFLIWGLGFSVTASQYDFWWAQGTSLRDTVGAGLSLGGVPAVGRFSFGATMTQSGTPTVTGYNGGVTTGSTTTNVGVPTGATGAYAGTNAQTGCSMTAAYHWRRALTADEMMMIHLDPFAMMIPMEADLPAMPPPLPPLFLMAQIVT